MTERFGYLRIVSQCNQLSMHNQWVNCFAVYLLKIAFTLLDNTRNHVKWPGVVSEDVSRNLNSLIGRVDVSEGLVSGRIVLPMPVESRDMLVSEADDDEQRLLNGRGSSASDSRPSSSGSDSPSHKCVMLFAVVWLNVEFCVDFEMGAFTSAPLETNAKRNKKHFVELKSWSTPQWKYQVFCQQKQLRTWLPTEIDFWKQGSFYDNSREYKLLLRTARFSCRTLIDYFATCAGLTAHFTKQSYQFFGRTEWFLWLPRCKV